MRSLFDVNVAVQCKIRKPFLAWALKAYRKYRTEEKTYAKDVKREIADIWIQHGGDHTFEDTDTSMGLCEDDSGNFFLAPVHFDNYKEKWENYGYKVRAVWEDIDGGTVIEVFLVVV